MAKITGRLQRRPRVASGGTDKTRNHKRVLVGSLIGLTLVLIVVLFVGGGTLIPLSVARRAVAARDYERADWWISVARRWDAKNADVEFLSARIARHEQRFADMTRHLENAARFGLDRKRLRREELLVLAADGQLDGIEEELHRDMGTASSDEIEICEALANGLAKVGRFDEAQMLLDAWRQDAPQDPYVHCRLGRIHEHFRRKEEASQEYRTALSKNPKCYEAAFALARLIAEQKRIEEALDYYRLCLELPHPVPAQVGMAGCLKSLGRANEARMLLEEAVQFSDHERAAAYKAVGEAPEQFVAATELGKLYSESGDYAKGAIWLGRAVEFNPRDLVARYALAGALRGLGYLEDAEQQFNIVRTARKALEQASTLNDQVEANPTDVDARYRLGKILLDYDSERKGLFYLRSVLTYNPNHEPTLSLLRDHESKSPMERLAALGGSAGLPREIASKANSVNIRSSTDKSKRPSREEPGSGPPPMDFVDATQRSGLQFTYHNGVDAGERSILESLGGGVGVWDYDRDGWPDLCFAGGGRLGPEKVISGLPTGLWRGVGPMRFQDVSTIAGVARSDYFTHGIAVGDYDNDGFEDLLITGYGGLQLFRNHGDGTFTQATLATGLTDTLWSTSACWADFNGDGNLDLFAAHYVDWSWKRHPKCPGAIPGTFDVCAPREFNPLPDVVYFSNGDGTFHDASEFAGLDPGGKGLGVVAADVDNDGDTDVYVANDTDNNFLYVNDGQGRFRESGFVSGTAVDHRGIPNGSMGIAVFDYDQDLALDIWVTNFENETFALYRNERDEAAFVCVSESTGITVLQKLLVGFGTVSGDFDLDGDEDIIVANGHVMYHPKNGGGAQEAVVLSNDGRGHFQQLQFSPDGFFGQKHWGRGLAASDLDRDGDLDLVFALNNEPAAIVANETNVASQSLTVRLFGTVSNRNGIGARAVLDTSHGQYLRSVCGGGSYLSQPEFQMFWGIPAGTVLHGLTVYWPSGTVQKVEVSAPGTRSLIEPMTGTSQSAQ